MEAQLVQFAQVGASPSLWGEAGSDAQIHGGALDRVFGARELHLLEHFAPALEAMPIVEDPLVALANFIDGVSLPMGDPVSLPTPEFTAVYDFSTGSEGLPPHELCVFDT